MARVRTLRRPWRRGARRRLRGRGGVRGSGAEAEAFAEVERHVRPDTILASNTSVIPITSIMQGLAARERALGTHSWKSAVHGAAGGSDRDAMDRGRDDCVDDAAARSGGQEAGACEKGRAGLHRQPPAARDWREAISLVENGICERRPWTTWSRPRSADACRPRTAGERRSCRHRSHARHPQHRAAAIDGRPEPSPYLQQLVADKKLGFKSGEGFRKWSPEEQTALRAKVMQHLKSMHDR